MKNNNVKLILLTLSVLFLLSFVAIESLNVNAALSSKCTDSDGGRVYTVKGTVKAVNGTNVTYNTDFCENEIVLNEYYCFNGIVEEEYYYCGSMGSNYMCKDGRCAINSTITPKTMFKSPVRGPQFLVNTTECTINAVPSQGTGPFTSNVTARFFNSTGPFPYTAVLKCNQNDAGQSIPVWYNGQFISRLCNYPQVNQQTFFTASASGSGANCYTTVTDNPQQVTCVDTDGGRNYGVRGLTYNNQSQNYTDTCQDPLRLREHWCSGNYIANEIVSCRDAGFHKCSLGRCIKTVRSIETAEGDTVTKSRFFLWGLFDIFRGKATGSAVRETSNEDSIFGWLILGVILVAGLMYYNKRQSTSVATERSSETSKSRSQRTRRR